jgi:hypothetical protein
LESKVTAFTNGGIVYASSTSALATGSALTFDGTTFQYTGAANFATSTGSVGIGTSSPSQPLHVSKNQNASTWAYVSNTTAGTGSAAGFLFASDVVTGAIQAVSSLNTGLGNSNSLWIRTTGAYPITLGTNSTVQATLDSSGNLGIGTTSPATKLDVRGTINASDGTNGNIRAYVDGTAAYLQSLNQAANAYRPLLLMGSTVSFANNGVTNDTLDSSGNLGIGETNPGAILDIKKAASGTVGPTLSLVNSATAAVGNAVDINMAGNPGGGALAPTGRIRLTEASAANSTMSFWTYDGTLASRMVIDPSGNLGIGTTSIGTRLQVTGANTTFDTACFGQMLVQSTTAYNATPRAGIAFSVKYTAGGTYTAGGCTIQSYKENSTDGDFGTGLLFTTQGNAVAPSEKMRLDSSGNLLVGDTTTIGTGGKFQVKSSTDTSIFKCTSSTTYAAIVSNVENTAARLMAFQYGSGGSPTNVGTITTNGTGVTYGTSSDYRLKENIAPMTGALDKVAQLKPVTYKWKANGSDGQGFIAHELKEVVPDAVQGEKDAVDEDGNPVYQGIDTSYLVATLTAAIQELKAEFDAYKASHP